MLPTLVGFVESVSSDLIDSLYVASSSWQHEPDWPSEPLHAVDGDCTYFVRVKVLAAVHGVRSKGVKDHGYMGGDFHGG